MIKSGVARSEIVHCKTNAFRAQFFQHVRGGDYVPHNRRFRQLEFEAPGVQAGVLQHVTDAVRKRFTIKFESRDIHRYSPHGEAFANPSAGLITCLVQYPPSNCFDEASVLCDRYEMAWRNETVRGPLPANQCFDPFYL